MAYVPLVERKRQQQIMRESNEKVQKHDSNNKYDSSNSDESAGITLTDNNAATSDTTGEEGNKNEYNTFNLESGDASLESLISMVNKVMSHYNNSSTTHNENSVIDKLHKE